MVGQCESSIEYANFQEAQPVFLVVKLIIMLAGLWS